MQLLEEYICEKKDVASNETIAKHADWIKEVIKNHPEIDRENVSEILKKEIGNVFVHVLEDAGVFKCTENGRQAFERFISVL